MTPNYGTPHDTNHVFNCPSIPTHLTPNSPGTNHRRLQASLNYMKKKKSNNLMIGFNDNSIREGITEMTR